MAHFDLRHDEVERAIVNCLGRGRVKSVRSEVTENADNALVMRVQVVYRASEGLTVDEMERVLNALWSDDASESAPFPVIDFLADTDVEPVAAE